MSISKVFGIFGCTLTDFVDSIGFLMFFVVFTRLG